MAAQKPDQLTQTDTQAAFASDPRARRTHSKQGYALWMALLTTALVAAGFGVSYLACANLTTGVPAASVESLGELWDGGSP